MISQIKLNKITSYQSEAVLETDKKVNLIYGLNGSGKSTFSNYLYETTSQDFTFCSNKGIDDDCRVLVYNQSFIQDVFYQSDTLNGIFTLSKENKEIEVKIKTLKNTVQDKKTEEAAFIGNRINEDSELTKENQQVENKLWEIKTKYTGGDRVLEFCLKGNMGSKKALKTHILSINKPVVKPLQTVDKLKKRAEAVNGENASPYNILDPITFEAKTIEQNPLFQEVIIGNTNSSVAELIEKLEHSDWVRTGLEFLPSTNAGNETICPFCQEPTITELLIEEINNYFDATYEKKISELKVLLGNYTTLKNALFSLDNYTEHPIIVNDVDTFKSLHSNLTSCIEKNICKIEDKVKSPSAMLNLDSSEIHLNKLNKYLIDKNSEVKQFNQRLAEKDKTLSIISTEFWQLMRWEYDQAIESYLLDINLIKKKIEKIDIDVEQINIDLSTINSEIVKSQKKTVNIEEAIESINSGLSDLGITGFNIQKHEDNKYKLIRNNQGSGTFQTLSEGEKMIISFLYFVELCRGIENLEDTKSKKIIVIDDPISSLSHLFIFNIGQLIKREFFNGNYHQVFVLTHSLYFFYELTDTNHKRRKDNQKLFRIQKNTTGSCILKMSYEEIQNDYQSYWMIVNDENQQPALIANCMRNVVEHFFNFVEKNDLNNVFLKPSLQKDKYQSFCRYINRESHSLGQNLFDLKEFDYSSFREGLKLIFIETGYDEHYKKMSKINNI